MRRSIPVFTAGLLAGSLAAAAEVVFVSAHVALPTASPGGANEGTCFVANSTDVSVRVRLNASVVFSDGKVQRLSGIQDPGPLDPGGAFELSVFFVIPQDTSLGSAQFVCDVTAQSRSLRERETQTAGFEVVP